MRRPATELRDFRVFGCTSLSCLSCCSFSALRVSGNWLNAAEHFSFRVLCLPVRRKGWPSRKMFGMQTRQNPLCLAWWWLLQNVPLKSTRSMTAHACEYGVDYTNLGLHDPSLPHLRTVVSVPFWATSFLDFNPTAPCLEA